MRHAPSLLLRSTSNYHLDTWPFTNTSTQTHHEQMTYYHFLAQPLLKATGLSGCCRILWALYRFHAGFLWFVTYAEKIQVSICAAADPGFIFYKFIIFVFIFYFYFLDCCCCYFIRLLLFFRPSCLGSPMRSFLYLSDDTEFVNLRFPCRDLPACPSF